MINQNHWKHCWVGVMEGGRRIVYFPNNQEVISGFLLSYSVAFIFIIVLGICIMKFNNVHIWSFNRGVKSNFENMEVYYLKNI